MSSRGINITLTGIVHALGIFSAWQLGRQLERPVKDWPQGTFFQGGWKQWRLVYIVLVAVSLAVGIVWPLLSFNLLPRVSIGRPGGYY